MREHQRQLGIAHVGVQGRYVLTRARLLEVMEESNSALRTQLRIALNALVYKSSGEAT